MQHGNDWRIGAAAAAAAIGVALAACGEVAPVHHDGGGGAVDAGADAAGPDAVGATTRLEPCRDVAPANASSIIVDVTTTFTPGVGWSDPAECAWTCDPDYCPQASSCEYAYTEQSFLGPSNGASWFGGDDSANGPRHIGGGQRLRTTSAVVMSQFAFHFSGPFRHSNGVAEQVTARLALRNSAGTILATSDVVVPADFEGGWVWWEIDHGLAAATDYVFTAWVIGGLDLGANTGISANTSNGYATGYRMGAGGQNDLSAWTLWSGGAGDTWDYLFRIRSAPACEQ